MSNEYEVHPDHQQAADDFEQLIAVDGVTVYAVGHRSFGIEVAIPTPDGPGIVWNYDIGDEDTTSEVVESLKSALDYLEEQGLDRDAQQILVASALDIETGR